VKILRLFLVQLRANLQWVSLIFAVSVVLVGIVYLLHLWLGIPISTLTRDPTAVAEVPPYTGFLSQIGVLFWFASAIVCIYSSRILLMSSGITEPGRFLFASGFLTMFFVLDDVFLFHEEIFPGIGIPERIVLISYGGLILLWLVRFYVTIFETDFIFLGLAFGFFGISLLLDYLNPPFIDPYLFEDGTKWAGIVSWFAYFSRVGASVLQPKEVQAGVARTELHDQQAEILAEKSS
jgi:hypothetical protein